MPPCVCLPGHNSAAQHFSCTSTSQSGCTKLSRLHLPGLFQQDRHASGMSGSIYAVLIVTSSAQAAAGSVWTGAAC